MGISRQESVSKRCGVSGGLTIGAHSAANHGQDDGRRVKDVLGGRAERAQSPKLWEMNGWLAAVGYLLLFDFSLRSSATSLASAASR